MPSHITSCPKPILKPKNPTGYFYPSTFPNQRLQIECIISRLQKRDSELFKRLVVAVKFGDLALSKMLAGEIAHIRNLARKLLTMLMTSQAQGNSAGAKDDVEVI